MTVLNNHLYAQRKSLFDSFMPAECKKRRRKKEDNSSRITKPFVLSMGQWEQMNSLAQNLCDATTAWRLA